MIKIYLSIILSLFGTICFALSDTLVICEGNSIQLETSPGQISYSWSPNQNISNSSIYNPVVSPLVSTTYYVTVEPVSNQNLVYNGDFSLGNIGFESEYAYTPEATFAQGFYGIFTSPTQFNEWFGNCTDHSASNDQLMMVVDGATVPDVNVWCQEIEVVPGRTYNFSAWITNIYDTEPSTLQFSINGDNLGDLIQVPENQCAWNQFSEEWFSGNNIDVTICLTNQSTVDYGNDFALDDITFILAEETYVDTFTVIVLESPQTTIDTVTCANEDLFIEGVFAPADTQILFNYPAINGCDSLVYININPIDTSYQETRVDTLCLGDTLIYQGWPITRDTAICEVYNNYLGCDSSICFVVYFLSEATIDVSIQPPSCFGENDGALNVTPFAGVPPFQYLWNTSAIEPAIENLTAGTYEVTITDAKNCIAIKNIELTEPPPLDIGFSIEPPSCYGYQNAEASFSIEGGTPDFLLYLNNYPIAADTFLNTLSAGSYEVLLEDQNGCLLESNFMIDQPAPIQIYLPPDTSVLLGCPLEVDAQIISSLPYELQWTPVINLDCSTCEDQVFLPLQDISYFLTVSDTSGCYSIDTLTISIETPYEIFVPNAFTPNGDGVNDYFEVYTGKDVEIIKSLSIYNRWGAEVFHSSDFEPGDITGSWDGRFKSKESTPGVFVYLVNVLFIDGTEKRFTGDVLLMK